MLPSSDHRGRGAWQCFFSLLSFSGQDGWSAGQTSYDLLNTTLLSPKTATHTDGSFPSDITLLSLVQTSSRTFLSSLGLRADNRYPFTIISYTQMGALFIKGDPALDKNHLPEH